MRSAQRSTHPVTPPPHPIATRSLNAPQPRPDTGCDCVIFVSSCLRVFVVRVFVVIGSSARTTAAQASGDRGCPFVRTARTIRSVSIVSIPSEAASAAAGTFTIELESRAKVAPLPAPACRRGW